MDLLCEQENKKTQRGRVISQQRRWGGGSPWSHSHKGSEGEMEGVSTTETKSRVTYSGDIKGRPTSIDCEKGRGGEEESI